MSGDLNTLARLGGTWHTRAGHRIGGLEKDQYTGDVSYDPVNHEAMVLIRDAKIRRIAKRSSAPKNHWPGKKSTARALLG